MQCSDLDLASQAARLAAALLDKAWHLGTAESCTGGWIAKTLTDMAGSSRWFERGWVVYSNPAKEEMLGVSHALLATHGAVSAPVVEALCRGVVAHSTVDCALAVSGVAGPDGGTPEKPVGTVWFAWAVSGRMESESRLFLGDREAVRRQTVFRALQRMAEMVAGGR